MGSAHAEALRAQASAYRSLAASLDAAAAELETAPATAPVAPPAPEPLLTIDELAGHLRRSVASLRRDLDAGMPARRLGDSLRFELGAVLAWYAARPAPTAKAPRGIVALSRARRGAA
ncbi:MAG TPA: hypothetical protein VHB21_08890 [Minicystis sp.]|nr:hypothetical protein [Minicystis sp.]